MIAKERFERKLSSVIFCRKPDCVFANDALTLLLSEHRRTIRLIKACAKHAKGASAEDMVRMILKKVEG